MYPSKHLADTHTNPGNIIEVFFDINLNTHNPKETLSELRKLSPDHWDAKGSEYTQISVPEGGLYVALDTNYRRMFVLFSNPFSYIYGEEDGPSVPKRVYENIRSYSQMEPPNLPRDIRHYNFEKWLLQNPQHYGQPDSRCGVYHWGIWSQLGKAFLGSVLTSDTNMQNIKNREKLLDLLHSFEDITHVKYLLLGAIDKPQRKIMIEAIKEKEHLKSQWSGYDNECFSLRACLVNLLTEPHLDSGDLNWAMGAPLGDFTNGEFCIADLERRFHYPPGSVSGILGCMLIHFTRLWTGTRLSLVSTMHESLVASSAPGGGSDTAADAEDPSQRIYNDPVTDGGQAAENATAAGSQHNALRNRGETLDGGRIEICRTRSSSSQALAQGSKRRCSAPSSDLKTVNTVINDNGRRLVVSSMSSIHDSHIQSGGPMPSELARATPKISERRGQKRPRTNGGRESSGCM